MRVVRGLRGGCPNYSIVFWSSTAMLFINNKYTVWYYKIVNHFTNLKIDGYTERHHIIPRSLGGKDNLENLVSLPARAHFICHLLLVKMTTGQAKMKMKYAATFMMGRNNITRTSRLYHNIRTGWKQNEEHIRKKVESRKGYRHSPETIDKLKNKARTRKPVYKTCKCGITIDAGNYKKYHGDNCGIKGLWKISDEQKQKISAANKGRVLPKIECPHCGKLADGGNYKRWHGNNCKSKKE